ncbi:peptidoglycan-binding domain-containing protein [Leptolyngbya sp. GB1-A1]|uniref:peptidoglycan-binding domain-containing protein n=1 Tax=Leptolyngbya sp. GB1-A1 TaxID=2933908 RepID=UPI0032973EB4
MLMPSSLRSTPVSVSPITVPSIAVSSINRVLRASTVTLLSLLTLGLLYSPAFSQTPPAATTEAASANRPVLRIGSQGESVTELQAMLKLLGYYKEVVNGSYQQSTADAVSAFQQSIGLDADGVVGSETWNRLLPPSPNASTTASTSPAPAPAPSPAPSPTPAPTPFPTPSPTPAPIPSPTPTRPTNLPATPPADSGTNAGASSETDSNSTSIDLPTLRPGMRGSAIERLQERLQALGFYDGEVDGIFGAQTQAAVEAAQRNFGLEPDGVVGPATWGALLR